MSVSKILGVHPVQLAQQAQQGQQEWTAVMATKAQRVSKVLPANQELTVSWAQQVQWRQHKLSVSQVARAETDNLVNLVPRVVTVGTVGTAARQDKWAQMVSAQTGDQANTVKEGQLKMKSITVNHCSKRPP